VKGLFSSQAEHSPQGKPLPAAAHLRLPPTSAKKVLRFSSPAQVPSAGRTHSAQGTAAQATARVMSGFGQVVAKLGISGFFGGVPAGNKAARANGATATAAAAAAAPDPPGTCAPDPTHILAHLYGFCSLAEHLVCKVSSVVRLLRRLESCICG